MLLLATIWASIACNRDIFTLLYLLYVQRIGTLQMGVQTQNSDFTKTALKVLMKFQCPHRGTL
jgi:hypothetical protein